MNWNEKANEIACNIEQSMKSGKLQDIHSALMQSALDAMAYECENWLHQKR